MSTSSKGAIRGSCTGTSRPPSTRCVLRIREIQEDARARGVRGTPRWPLVVLRTPKGWTGPKELNGLPVEGTFRSHQVPLTKVRTDPAQLAMLESWMRSYQPEKLFDGRGRLVPELAELAPKGDRRMGKNPNANAPCRAPLDLPPFARYAVDVPRHGAEQHESTRQLGMMLRDMYTRNPTTFRLFCPDETNSNRLGAVFETQTRCFEEASIPIDDHISADGRVMEVLSEHNCQGWLEGYLLTGRHGLFATYEAFALIVASMATQHVKWLETIAHLPWRAPIPSLNYLLTSTCWRNDHNGFSHQGPGFMDTIISKKGTVARVYLPPDANCLLSVADHCFRSSNYVNLIIIDKQRSSSGSRWRKLASTAKKGRPFGIGRATKTAKSRTSSSRAPAIPRRSRRSPRPRGFETKRRRSACASSTSST